MDTNNSYPPPQKKIIMIYLVYQYIANLELLYGWDWEPTWGNNSKAKKKLKLIGATIKKTLLKVATCRPSWETIKASSHLYR